MASQEPCRCPPGETFSFEIAAGEPCCRGPVAANITLDGVTYGPDAEAGCWVGPAGERLTITPLTHEPLPLTRPPAQ